MRPLNILLIAVLVGLTACTPVINKRGNTLDDSLIAQIHVGETSREEVAKILGTPTQTGTFDDKVWYYIGQRTEQEAFFDPVVEEQKVVTVQFTPEGKVAALTTTGMQNNRDISPVADRTPTSGKEMSVMQQLLGNLGRPSVPSTPGKVGQ